MISIKSRCNIIIVLILCLSCTYSFPHSRKLSESSQPTTKTSKICEKTSSKFSQYYKIGDRNILNMDEDNTEKYDSYYVKALINIVRHYYDKKKSKQNNNARKLEVNADSSYKKNVLKYSYHILPLLMVLGIGILSLVAWVVWGICVCQKCKCCVCKVPKCKTPSIVLALIFYVIVALISLYALVEENKVFTGLADLECSILKFTDEVLYGENTPYPPFWAGIDNIRNILGQITSKINELKPNTLNELESLKDEVNTNKGLFQNTLQNAGNIIKNNYTKTYGINDYQLDIANQFGIYNKINNEASPEKSISYFWLNEYNSLAIKSKNEMVNTIDSFSTVFNANEITQSLSDADIKLGEIKSEFISLKNLIADKIIEKADNIDKKGHIIYALFFSLLIIFCAAIIIFMLLLCCCSGEVCTNLTCFQYVFKYFLHVFWNIMALVMFLLFMGGSWFTISGVLGDDLVNVISYIISEDNLGQDKDTIILGNVKQYLNRCFNDDGNILSELGFKAQMESFEKLKETQLVLEEIKNQFSDKLNKFVYNEYLEELKDRVEFNSPDFKLISVNSGITPNSYNFTNLLQKINDYANTNNKKEKWDITSTTNDICSQSNPDNTAHDSQIIYHPKNCYPIYKSWINDVSLSDYKNKLIDMKNLIESANDENDINSIKSLLIGLDNKYNTYLQSEIENLGKFVNKIKQITDLAKNYTSEDDTLFSFMNCNFIKSNVEVILYYLKNSFQNDIYEVGVYLLIAAFAMPFAISFTILLIVISNEEIEKNKEKESKKSKNKNKKKDIMIDEKIIGNDLLKENDITINKNDGNNSEHRQIKDDKEKIA